MKKLFLLFFIPFIFSCTTLQQDVNIEQVSYSDEVLAFEQRLASIDASFLLPDVDLNDKLQKEQKVEDFLTDIEESLSDNSIQKSSRARMFALQGKAWLILGKKSKAKDSYENSVAEYKGDTQAVILSNRLGLLKISNIEEKNNEVSEKFLLVLEHAIQLYKSKNYLDSVAKFDESFLSLDEFYQDSYKNIRDLAWNLRNIDSNSEVANLMLQKEITVAQMLSIAKNKSDYLYNLTGGRKMNDKNFYYKVSSTGLLNPVSKPLDSSNTIGLGDIVTKYYSARFLWNLYNLNKNPSNSKKYSNKFTKSPVQDLDFNSPDFDAVLGCIENEFMILEDGKNFVGEKSVSAVEFDSFMEKLNN